MISGGGIRRLLLLFSSLAFFRLSGADAATRLQIPLSFEANRGQAIPDVRFVARGNGYGIALGDTQNRIVLRKTAIGFRFPGSAATASFRGQQELAGRVNYLHSHTPSAPLVNIPTFAQIRQSGVYPGIDVVYYGSGSHLEYDFVVSPGSNPRQIAVRFDNVDHISIDAEGDLHIYSQQQEIIQHKPIIYQGARPIDGKYRRVDARTVAFELGHYDHSRVLVIDPVLTYSTFIGGSDGDENARAIVTDSAGNIYMAGSTTSTNFPTVNPIQSNAGSSDPSLGFGDAFILKLNPSGSSLIYSTYLGGSNDDAAVGIALDGANNVIVTGTTTSTDFPVTGSAFRGKCTLGSDGTCSDTFVAKLNSTGSSLIFATYLGGSDDDQSSGVAVDPLGNIYVAGDTSSTDFPMAGSPYSTASSEGAYISKFGPAGTFIASTYFGVGTGTTDIRAIAADSAGNVYVTGATSYSNATATDVFVAKLNTSLSSLVYTNFIRGSNNDAGNAIVVDTAGDAYVAGQTSSRNFTVTAGAPQQTLSGGPVFKTGDAGSTWAPTANGIPRTSVYALAVTSTTPSVIYAGTDDEIEGGLYKSMDGGATWTETDSGLSLDSRVHAIAIDPKTPSTMYAGTRSAGLYRSLDSGKTWIPTSLTNLSVTVIAIDASNSATIYAGTDGSGIYKSADGGATWAAANNGLTSLGIRAIAIDPSTSSTIYVGTPAGLFKSIDRAGSWNSSGSGLLDPNVNGIAIDPRNPNLVYAATSTVGIFRSLNAGSFWLAASSGIPSLSSGLLASALSIDPNTGTLFAAAGESNALQIYKSSNGITWTSTGLATTRTTALAVDRSTPNTVYAATIGSADAFVSKWDPSGALIYSTYLGGYRDDSGNGIAVDATGDIYFVGSTSSVNFPIANAVQSTFGGGSDIVTDAFVAKVNPATATLLYSTYLGGTSNDFGNAITLSTGGDVYVAGQTGSGDFPTASALMSQRGSLDAFVARISEITAIPYSVRVRGGYSVVTQGSGSAVTAGFGRITPAAGSTTPQGMAIFGFRANNILVSEAAVPASVPISSGRLYAEVGGAIDTGLAIANPAGQAVTVTFYVTTSSGDGTQQSTTIGANSQIAAFLDQPPFNLGTNLKGTLTFTASSPVAVIALRGRTNERGEFLITTLPVVDLSLPVPTGGSGVVFPHYADGGGWTTEVVLVNPTDNALSGSIQFYSPPGQIVGTPSAYSIAARGSFTLQTAGIPSSVQGGSIHLTPDGNGSAPSGVAIFAFTANGITVTEAGVPAVSSGSAFRLYAEASGFFNTSTAGAIQTGLAVVNLSSNSATVNFELSGLDGNSTGSGSITIPANGQSSLFIDQILGLPSLPNPFQGVLRVSSTSQIAVIGLRARYNERRDFLITTTPPTNEANPAPTSELFFPHFADGGGYTTQFILYNGSTDQTASGTIRFFTQSGQLMSLSLR